MAQDSHLTEAASVITEHCAQRAISDFAVLGVNSLKTVAPQPAQLIGEQILGARTAGDVLEISTTKHVLRVDLQRTGKVVYDSRSELWKPGQSVAMPTAQLIFSDGSGIRFTEPAKTKRITVSVLDQVE